MKNLKTLLGINERFTKVIQADKTFTKVKDNVPLIKNYNFMMDVLHLPTDKFGYNKLLVCVDLATDEFDIQPMKGETSEEVLKAFIKMFSRGYIKLPYSSISTDGGSSFKSVLPATWPRAPYPNART